MNFALPVIFQTEKAFQKRFLHWPISDYLKDNRELSIKSIKYGQKGEITVNGVIYNGVMAPMGLTDEEVADVMNYITNAWGNTNNKMITVEEVSQIQE